MRNKMKQVLTLVLSLIMVLSITACGDNQNVGSNDEQQNDQNDQNDNSGEGSGEVSDEREPITLTVGYFGSAGEDGIHEDNLAFQQIKEDLGISIEWKMYDEEKYALWAAGGDLPDILRVNNDYGSTVDLIESGQLLPLDDLLKEYGTHILEIQEESMIKSNENYDAIYLIGFGPEYPGTEPLAKGEGYAISFRYDIYQKIGSPKMETQEDVLNVLKQMQDYERDRTGEDDIYALAAAPSYGMFGLAVGWSRGMGWYWVDAYDINPKTLEIRPMYTDGESSVWQHIEFMNKGYQMGIMDPDALTLTYDQFWEKVEEQGKILTIPMHSYGSMNAETVGEDAIFTHFPGYFTNIPLLYGKYNTGVSATHGYVISTNCEYPERAMELLDYLQDPERGAHLYINGIQGLTWEYDENGVPNFTDEMYEKMADGTFDEYMADKRLKNNEYQMRPHRIYDENGNDLDAVYNADYYAFNANAATKKVAESFGVSYLGEVYEKWIEAGTSVTDELNDLMVYDALTANRLPNDSEVEQVCKAAEDYIFANLAKVVFAETDEEFAEAKEDIIKGLVELGLNDAFYEKVAELWEPGMEAALEMKESLK